MHDGDREVHAQTQGKGVVDASHSGSGYEGARAAVDIL